ncbi:MAG: Asp-tRNA(Asn)/Glu-tRNA(Gln) amidotransferase subunit GatC [Candidatus Magasanikbacteria bacterium]
MKISPDKVEHIAQLARLELSQAEKERYAEELSVVLDYVEKLEEVETEGVEPTFQVSGLTDVTREDEVEEISDEDRSKIIEEFPSKEGRMLKVQEVFDNE